MSNIGEKQFGTFQFGSYEEDSPPSFTGAFGQAQADIKATRNSFGQAQADIKAIGRGYGQAQCSVSRGSSGFGQAQADVKTVRNGFGQANSDIKAKANGFGQAQAQIRVGANGYGQAQADVKAVSFGFGQANADVKTTIFGFGQAQCFVINGVRAFGQAQAFIVSNTTWGFGQAQVFMLNSGLITIGWAQAQASIRQTIISAFGQAQALIGKPSRTGQAQAYINAFNVPKTGMAQAYIKRVQDVPTNPINPANSADVKYLARFNGYDIPGYAQEELYDSTMNQNLYQSAYSDRGQIDNLGLANKVITLKEKLIGLSYLDSKTQLQRAATILSTTNQFAKLYIQNTDKYYLAMAKGITMEKAVPSSPLLVDYSIDFEAKPWLFSDTVNTITGSGTLITTGRTLYDGGWAPTTVSVTGTDVTISGYTDSGDFAGYISLSGAVADMTITSEEYTAIQDGVNRNDLINNIDYWLYVGVGVTTFVVAGADNVTITWTNRWYL